MIQRFEDHLSLSALPDVVYYDDPRYKILRRALHSSRTPREYSAGFLPIFPANFQRYSFYVSNDSLVTSCGISLLSIIPIIFPFFLFFLNLIIFSRLIPKLFVTTVSSLIIGGLIQKLLLSVIKHLFDKIN